MTSLVRQFQIKRIDGHSLEVLTDTVAAEEPLEIRLSYWFKDAKVSDSLALAMRSPGDDLELTAGFIYSEGIIRQRTDVVEIRTLGGGEESNEILVELAADVDVDTRRLARTGFLNSSCGVCGKRSIDSVVEHIPIHAVDNCKVAAAIIRSLPDILRKTQFGFAQTGGLHAAALITPEGEMEVAFEDIGRHNALDKLIGWCLLHDRLPLTNRIVFLSSRSSFELIQKAAVAGVPVIATVGSPSSLAVESARRYGQTLIGFVRGERFNIYSGDWRIDL